MHRDGVSQTKDFRSFLFGDVNVDVDGIGAKPVYTDNEFVFPYVMEFAHIPIVDRETIIVFGDHETITNAHVEITSLPFLFAAIGRIERFAQTIIQIVDAHFPLVLRGEDLEILIATFEFVGHFHNEIDNDFLFIACHELKVGRRSIKQRKFASIHTMCREDDFARRSLSVDLREAHTWNIRA